jgi:hypothetical protein
MTEVKKMKDRITKREYLAFAKEHAKDTELQVNLTDCEIRLLLHTLGYDSTYYWVYSAEWRNAFDNGKVTSHGDCTEALKHLCKLSIMEEKIIDKHYVYFATELGKKVARIKYVQYVKEKKLKEGV